MDLDSPDSPLLFTAQGVTWNFPQDIARALVDVDLPNSLRSAARSCTYLPARLTLRISAKAIEAAAHLPGRPKRPTAAQSARPVPHPCNSRTSHRSETPSHVRRP
ncbi:hypothetical protein ES703_26814 [subsurface metagenome]